MSEQTQTRVEESDLRGIAIAQLGKKRDLQAHALAYTAVQTFLIAIWFATGAGFFWPMIPIFGWGIGLAFHAWDVFSPTTPSEQQIEREMARLRARRRAAGRALRDADQCAAATSLPRGER